MKSNISFNEPRRKPNEYEGFNDSNELMEP